MQLRLKMSRSTYHHGDLRNALIELATEQLEAEGLAGVSLRHLAERLGVARSAPYQHFKSRDALLEAIVLNVVEDIREGFQQIQHLRIPADDRASEGFRWYLAFARRRPEIYKLLYSSDYNWRIDIHEEAQSHRSLGALIQIVADVAGTADPDQLRERAVAVWSLLHGHALLCMNPSVNQGGFIESKQDNIVALALACATGRV